MIFTGNGKGKTTASLGQALRSAGDKRKTLMVQFIKGPWASGEDTSHKKLAPYLKIIKTGKGFVGIGGDTRPRSVHRDAAKEGLALACAQAMTDRWDMLILDEVWNALHLKLLTQKDVRTAIQTIKPHVEHLIMTGRDCPASFIKMADLVTEMREIKHPFAVGIKGKKGLEY